MHSPRSLNKLQKLQFMQRNHLHQFSPHYPLGHFSAFRLPQRSLCFVSILESCWCPLAMVPCEHTQPGSASPTRALQAQGQLQGDSPWPRCQQPGAAFSPAPQQSAAMWLLQHGTKPELTACLLVGIIATGFNANYDDVRGLTSILWLTCAYVFAR